MLHEILMDIVAERKTSFWGCDLIVVNTKSRVDALKKVTGLDYRVRLADTEAISSLFSGLEFDSEKTRTFSVGVFDGEVPVGVLSIAIAPKRIFSKEKYYKIVSDGSIVVQSFQNAIDPDVPEYLVSPAWAKLDEHYRARIGRAFINLIRRLTLEIIDRCSETVGVEVIAQGQLVLLKNMPYIVDSSRFIIGQKIDPKKLGFNVSQVWVARKESIGTEKFARILWLTRCEWVGQVLTLGSVFYRRMK